MSRRSPRFLAAVATTLAVGAAWAWLSLRPESAQARRPAADRIHTAQLSPHGAASRRSLNSACPTFLLIDSRGSGAPAGTLSPPGAAFASGFRALHRSARVAIVANPYPAVGLGESVTDIAVLVATGANPTTPDVYDSSVAAGLRWLSSEIRSQVANCPATKLLLTGYSQGAEVVADTYQRELPQSERIHIRALVLFGDPLFNPADTRTDRGGYLPTRGGLLGMRPSFGGDPRVLSYCHLHDPICQRPTLAQALLYGLAQHRNYGPDAAAAAARYR